MGTSILKGVTAGLLGTVLTLLAVLGTTMAGIDDRIISYLVDFGLLLSCLAAGLKASSSSGRILPSGIASGGYAVVGVLLLALYFPIDRLAALRIISEGTGLGLIAGVLGAGILSSPRGYGGSSLREDSYPDYRYSSQGMGRPLLPEPEPVRESDLRKENLGNDYYYRRTGNIAQREYDEKNSLQRAKIYDICDKQQQEEREIEDAFAWWEVETKRQLKG